MHNKPATLVILSVFLFAFIYILLVNIAAFELSPDSLDNFGKYTQIPLAVIPLIGAFFGLQSSSKWGFTKSLVGKATLFLSLSMLAWGGGMICWLAYIFILGIDNVPYPSMGDFVFLFIQPFSYVGVYMLGRVIGVRYGLRTQSGKLLLFLIPIVTGLVSYFLLYQVARGGNIGEAENFGQTFFNYYYPIVTAIGLGLVANIFVLSHGFLGGKYKWVVYMLFAGLVFQYFGDFWYTLSNNNGTYFNGYWPDVLYTVGLFLISWAVANIAPDNISKKQ